MRGGLLAGVLFAGAAVLGACGRNAEPTVTVFAASSLAAALDEIGGAPGARFRASYAASSILAKQIDAGAPADVYVAADPRWMDWLEERGRLAPGSRREIAGNTLVVVAPSRAAFRWDPDSGAPLAEAFEGALALGDPDHVPLGRYAREALTSRGAWAALAPRVIAMADARATLAAVERGECASAIVYRTDALASGRVVIVARIPDAWHRPIVYPAARVAAPESPTGSAASGCELAERYLEWLGSSRSRAILERRGFVAAPAAGSRE